MVLKKHKLKLNLEKCSFSVQVGKFLGFILTQRGIKANPEKCEAMINMRSPKSIMKFQQLAKRITILTFNTTMIQELGKDQHLIYFISKILQRVDTQYQKIKKGSPSLGLLIKQVLRKPDLVGRMVRWTVKLSKFDISFKRKGHIKVQVLSDFITKLAPTGEPSEFGGEWTLLVDGVSNQISSGAEIIWEGSYEYKALLARMRVAEELGDQVLTIKSDFQLATAQVNGHY
ncbi:hypothetical protein CR513_54770, partial [Mucuna pruriens]